MKEAYEFIKECGVFFVSTINNTKPSTRPFGAIMEYMGNLYITTGTNKEVYKQMKQNKNIQIVALKNGTRNWIRLDGLAYESNDLSLKQKMLEECPILNKRYSSVNDKMFALFKITVTEYNIY